MQLRFTPDQHRFRAIVGIGLGLVFALVAGAGPFLDPVREDARYWSFLVLPALISAVWGCSHLARRKGYPAGAAYGLFAFALLVVVVAGFQRSPLGVGWLFLFVDILPPLVLLAMPRKPRYLRRW